MMSEAQKRAQKIYDAKISRVVLKLRPDEEGDVVKFLETKPSKQKYIIALIRKAMESEQQ